MTKDECKEQDGLLSCLRDGELRDEGDVANVMNLEEILYWGLSERKG